MTCELHYTTYLDLILHVSDLLLLWLYLPLQLLDLVVQNKLELFQFLQAHAQQSTCASCCSDNAPVNLVMHVYEGEHAHGSS